VLRFGERFAAAPGRTHGGVVVGAIACAARRASGAADPSVVAISARLHRAVVPGREVGVEVTVDADGLVEVVLADDVQLLATAAVRVVDGALARAGLAATLFGPERLEPLLAAARSAAGSPSAPVEDRYPSCFGCGRAHSGGLQLAARPTSTVTAFAPAPGLSAWAEADGRLDTVVALAAPVCPSTAALRPAEAEAGAILLGSLEAELLGWPPAEVVGGYGVAAHRWRRDGRKVLTDAALVDGSARPVVLATATWILAPDAAAATP